MDKMREEFEKGYANELDDKLSRDYVDHDDYVDTHVSTAWWAFRRAWKHQQTRIDELELMIGQSIELNKKLGNSVIELEQRNRELVAALLDLKSDFQHKPEAVKRIEFILEIAKAGG